MKRIIIAAMLIFAIFCSAVEFKAAYIDTQEIMNKAKDIVDAKTEFGNYQQSWEKQINDKKAEITKLKNEYEAKKVILTDSGRDEAEKLINEKEKELNDFIESIFGDSGLAAQRNNELLEPILVKLQEAIKRVADQNNYSIVLDASGGTVVYAVPGIDITQLVIDELDKDGQVITDDSDQKNNNGDAGKTNDPFEKNDKSNDSFDKKSNDPFDKKDTSDTKKSDNGK